MVGGMSAASAADDERVGERVAAEEVVARRSGASLGDGDAAVVGLAVNDEEDTEDDKAAAELDVDVDVDVDVNVEVDVDVDVDVAGGEVATWERERRRWW